MTKLGRLFLLQAALLLPLALLSAQTPTSPTLHGDRAHRAHAPHWVDTHLYFGLGPADAPGKASTKSHGTTSSKRK